MTESFAPDGRTPYNRVVNSPFALRLESTSDAVRGFHHLLAQLAQGGGCGRRPALVGVVFPASRWPGTDQAAGPTTTCGRRGGCRLERLRQLLSGRRAGPLPTTAGSR